MLSPLEKKQAREFLGDPTDPGRAEYWQLLAVFYALATRCEDRGAQAKLWELEYETGLPDSANLLAARSRTVGGPSLALEFHMDPRLLAASWVRRPDPHDPEGPGVGLQTISIDHWTAEEKATVDLFAYRVKRAAHRMAEEMGWFRTRVEVSGYTIGAGDDGLCQGLRITPKGLDAALDLIPGTAYASGPSGASGLAKELGYERWKNAPQWAQQEAKR